jgi:molybdenum cofactor cytidylyltransferase
MIAAVVPAAGRSSRMGRPKLALPVGGRPMLERVIAALLEGGASPVVVVTGLHDPSLAPLARAAGADVCELAAATPDMRTTVEHGLRWLEERYRPRPEDAFLLTPADMPFLDKHTVRSLCDKWQSRGAASILLPTYGGRRGHPALIAWRHVEPINALPADIGVDVYLRKWTDEVGDVIIQSEAEMTDVDTAEDYLPLLTE